MTAISDVLARHHALCDSAFLEAESAGSATCEADTAAAFDAFAKLLNTHLDAEEAILFPAVRAITPAAQGPTGMMCTEHAQMRGLVEAMRKALAGREPETYAHLCDMFLALSQQHNFKEEHMLYPMCDRALQANAALIERLNGCLTA